MSVRPWEQLKPGETWRGLWDAGEAGWMPVLAARGTQFGPALLITSGVHGDEYEGPAAIHALFASLDVAGLAGTVLGLPVVNGAAWEARARRSPVDGADLNRLFPGRAGSPSETLAALVFEKFVAGCDVLWDLHSGGTALIHLPLAGWYAGETGGAERLARGGGAGLRPWLIPDVPGVLSYEAHRSGKVAVGAEWGGGARLEAAGVAAYTNALQASLETLGMNAPHGAFRPAPNAEPPIAGDYVAAPASGLFVPTVSLGDTVPCGAELGTISDALGEQVCRIEAARSGIVAGLASLPWLRAGDRVAYIG